MWHRTLFDEFKLSAYKCKRSVLWPSKYGKMCFRPGSGLCPRLNWGSSWCYPRPHSRLGMGHYSPYPDLPPFEGDIAPQNIVFLNIEPRWQLNVRFGCSRSFKVEEFCTHENSHMMFSDYMWQMSRTACGIWHHKVENHSSSLLEPWSRDLFRISSSNLQGKKLRFEPLSTITASSIAM